MSEIKNPSTPSYEQQLARLDSIVKKLDEATTPIDDVAAFVKEGTNLLLHLNDKLRSVETEVADAFRALDESATRGR